MLRKLLTLLAICAGLAAVAEPARAAAIGVESVHLVEPAGLSCVAGSVAANTPANATTPRWQTRDKVCPKPTIVLIVPTVMLKVDRSRE